MADTDPKAPEAPQTVARPYGPGVLMVFGLVCLVVAAWCGWEIYTNVYRQDLAKDALWLVSNWGGAIGFAIGAIYAFVLAGRRSKQAAQSDGEGGANKPREPGA